CGGGLQDAAVTGALRKQVPAVGERVLAGGVGQLVDEGFRVEAVLRVGHAAPRADADVRGVGDGADRLVGDQIGDGVRRIAALDGRVVDVELPPGRGPAVGAEGAAHGGGEGGAVGAL